MAEMQGVLAQLEEFGTKTVHLGATHRFRRTGSDVGNPYVPGGTTRLAKVDDHTNDLDCDKPTLDVVLSEYLLHLLVSSRAPSSRIPF